MSDTAAPTMIESDEGLLPFQHWFVERQWQPAVRLVKLPEGIKASAAVVGALEGADLIIIAPSNPFVSVDPILNVYPIREMIFDLPQLVVAISPIVGGKAVKGPAAKMMAEMGLESTPANIASYYRGLIDLFIYDDQDPGSLRIPDMITFQTDTVMTDPGDRYHLATEILKHSMELIRQ